MFRHGFEDDGDAWSLKCGQAFDLAEKRTKDSFAEESDINTIVKRFGLTGQLPTDVRAPVYGDFSEAMDFRECMAAVVAAQEAFDAMPADVRWRFGNSPAAFADFCVDPANGPELVKLGLAVPKETIPEVVRKEEPTGEVKKP